MTFSNRAIRFGAGMFVGLVATTAAAVAMPTGLSTGMFQAGSAGAEIAVYAYDPDTRAWTELSNVSSQEVTSTAHSRLVFQATAPEATSVSTFHVLFSVLGQPYEVFMTPAALERLVAGQSTTLTINLF